MISKVCAKPTIEKLFCHTNELKNLVVSERWLMVNFADDGCNRKELCEQPLGSRMPFSISDYFSGPVEDMLTARV